MKVSCYTKDENGEYTVDTGVKFVSPLMGMKIPIVEKAMKKMSFDPKNPKTV